MKVKTKGLALFLLPIGFGVAQFAGQEARAQSSYFSSRGCTSCHSTPVVASCNACHYHGAVSLKAATNKTSYTPGETVTATLSGGSRSGWMRAILLDQANNEIASTTGNASGMGGSGTFPAALAAAAPTTPGTYTWKMSYYGNNNGNGHAAVTVNTNSFTVAAPADTTAPTVSTFTVPATSSALAVSGISIVASDNVGVTGYRLTESGTAPLASATGWSASAPTSYTFASEGSKTLYAWAKDAAGNVSAAKSAAVTITLPPPADTTAPTVSTFTVPATSSALTVNGISVAASDNVGVTGYRVSESSTAPLASAAGWSASAPTSYTFASEGAKTLYAWAKDAAGNVSAAKTAAVTITLPPPADTTAPTVSTFTVPATSSALTVSGISIAASDNVGVTGYRLTESATAPIASAAGWAASAPTSYTFSSEGAKTLYAWAKDAAGNVSASSSAVVTVTLPPVETKPVLAISALANGASTNVVTLNISGSATDPDGIATVTVNGEAVAVNVDGSFSSAVTLAEGANTITIVATDKAGSQQSDIRTITYDPAAPVLTVEGPADNSSSSQSFITVNGTVNENSTVVVSDNGGNANNAAITGSAFTATVNLVDGVNTITITATDLAGNTASAKRTITYDAAKMTLSIISPNQDITTKKKKLTLSGKVVGATSRTTVRAAVGDKIYKAKVGKRGTFKLTVSFKEAKQYTITITATDAAGNTTTATRNVIYAPKVKGDDDKVINHPFGWSDPKKSHPDYLEDNSVTNCTSCHSIDSSSKGKPMSCYNCHGKEWDTPSTGGGSTGGDTGSTINHPFGWTNPESSHRSYVNSNGVSSCTSCHSVDASSKGQPMSCFNCHGQEWDTPSTGGSTGGSTGTTTSHPFGWTDPERSHKSYVNSNGTGSCTSCHSTSSTSTGKMSCYNCHGKEW